MSDEVQELDEELPLEEVVEDEPEELTITIEGEEPESDDLDGEELGEKGQNAVRKLREALKESKRRERELEAKVQTPAPEPVKARDKPTFEAHGYNDAAFEADLLAWHDEQKQVAAAQAKAKARVDAGQADYTARFDGYTGAKKALRVADFDDSEDKVRSVLSTAQQSIILRVLGAEEAARAVYALGRSPKALAELAQIDGEMDRDKFAARLVMVAQGIKVTQKNIPAPEGRLTGGLAPASNSGSFTVRMAAAEKAAERSGDRTQVIQLRREMKAAGK